MLSKSTFCFTHRVIGRTALDTVHGMPCARAAVGKPGTAGTSSEFEAETAMCKRDDRCKVDHRAKDVKTCAA